MRSSVNCSRRYSSKIPCTFRHVAILIYILSSCSWLMDMIFHHLDLVIHLSVKIKKNWCGRAPPTSTVGHVATITSVWNIRVLHVLADTADNSLTGDLGLARPHWSNMAWLSWYAKYPNPLQIYGWVICWVMFAYRCWSEFKLIHENLFGIPASFLGFSKQTQSNYTC